MGEGVAWHWVGLREVGMDQTTQGSDYRLYPQLRILDFMLRAIGAGAGVVKSMREQAGIMEQFSRAPNCWLDRGPERHITLVHSPTTDQASGQVQVSHHWDQGQPQPHSAVSA